MAATKFDGLLNWRLKHGSHGFPGPEGGTCINEAAVVVAGFQYREVATITDLPESFCPVISQFCLTLNDSMPEGDILNRLRPFALRLSGSADTRKVAQQRALHLALKAATQFVPMAIGHADEGAATRLRQATDPQDTLSVLDELLARYGWTDDAEKSLGAAHLGLGKALKNREGIYVAELAAISAIRSAKIDPDAWSIAIEAIQSVLAIGRQADPIETELIDRRAQNALLAAAAC